jgi:hypothetical protein
MSRNPYHNPTTEPRLRPSVLGLMDILGYSAMIREAAEANAEQESLIALHAALAKGRRWLDMGSHPETSAWLPHDNYALKAFTDNIAIAWPIREDAESELGDALHRMGAFQFEMAVAGYFVRGAIAIGNAYVDEIAVFGNSLIEAYTAEQNRAINPRIVLTESALAALEVHLSYYGNSPNAPQVGHILRDSDGQLFLNYLSEVLYAVPDSDPFYDDLLRHKAAVEGKLAQFKECPRVLAKYRWVGSYHNYFCDLHAHHFGSEYRIGVPLPNLGATQIVASPPGWPSLAEDPWHP